MGLGYLAFVLCVHAKSFQPCPTLCDPVDCNLPGSSVHGILQQEYRSRLSCPSPGDLPNPGIKPALRLLYWQAVSIPLMHLGSPTSLALILPREKKRPRNLEIWMPHGGHPEPGLKLKPVLFGSASVSLLPCLPQIGKRTPPLCWDLYFLKKINTHMKNEKNFQLSFDWINHR